MIINKNGIGRIVLINRDQLFLMQLNNTQIQLAIIIPYYKDRYIDAALRSIEQQTNKLFNIYIGDDNSPYPIKELLDNLDNDFKDKIKYHRFNDNMGSVSLTKQWERCIGLSKNEPYIWLFSDDDIMPFDAVERFYEFVLNKETIDVLRFNVQIIDDNNKVVLTSKPHPAFETAKQFLYRRLNGECVSTACEYIFSRKVYHKKNGFVEFPLAWASDDASWANFAEVNGIFTMAGNPVSWRMGGFNISSDKTLTYERKIEATILYLKFVAARYEFDNKLRMKWLFGQLSLLQPSSSVKRYFYTALVKSRLFTNGFIAKQVCIKNFNHYLVKIKRRLPQ